MAEITKKLVDGAGLQTAIGIMANYSDNMDRGVVGGYNQSFPLTAATKGNIYYHKPTNRYYLCVNNYSGSSLTNPNSNFIELSVYTNRQRLDGLSRYEKSVVRFTTANVDANFEKIGNVVILTIDTASEVLQDGDTVVVPSGFRNTLRKNIIIAGVRDDFGTLSGSIRVYGDTIEVQQTASKGTLFNAVWFTW